jgi:hypothetical protein
MKKLINQEDILFECIKNIFITINLEKGEEIRKSLGNNNTESKINIV